MGVFKEMSDGRHFESGDPPKLAQANGSRFRTVREGLPHPLIQFDETGMAFTAWHADGSASKTELGWNEVNGVVAYRHDCYAIDLD
jgi:hypothetical protein